MKGLSVYFHIPFCKTRCRYCNFNSYSDLEFLFDDYASALRQDFYSFQHRSQEFLVQTVYLGGGTPSLLSLHLLEEITKSLKGVFHLSPGCEVSIEVNPETIYPNYAHGLQGLGINRISLGVQSFDPQVLRRLGRGHDVEQSIRSFQFLRRAGFDNINIDLIFGVPGQSLPGWQRTLESALALEPEHLSLYCLTIEKDLKFKTEQSYAGELDQVLGERYLVDEKTQMEMMQLSQALLEREGFQHYEISNFCLPGFQCQHNLTYWRRGEYLGFGAGAHSFLEGKRFSRIEDPKRFIAAVKAGQLPLSFQEELSPEQELLEEIYLRLRTNSGFEGLDWLKYQGILERKQFLEKMERLREEGFVEGEGEKVCLTNKGRFLVDSLILELV
ncbi:hypothetical protein HKBW3S44_00022 [Candidatus Hakubella thermalkaliphila]|uniref:Heme chaperone HemW n=2 Tax=Candidatus Hakubella thermalkaliphila TaxID=2754717 RepID=A0A6V8NRU9_9ACTN|nr:radical SAM family heme chaperone HemW [Candidatus Hakubella thermalkaliphila]GFP23058.1 hypothetical protein HKBW3S09_00525 [Candidatus Hakubella thermalkaliphila]GFP29923.1 hypothetical protein HKBW3S34_00843 [Candidatus Hakubella thermalkaliphila]GFP36339.1 hypothetical protein HKBW3S44_00022 [Candidatus Hakubella thermalkaliphila]